MTPWVQYSQHAWFKWDTHFPLLHTHTFYIWHHYTCIHLVRASHLLSLHISSSYMTLSSSLYQRRIQTSLELSGWVFTCLWTLGSTSSVMVGPVRLLIYLWWCFHVDSWHVVSWLTYILDLESWSAFVWSLIWVLLYQHSFSVASVSFKHLFINVRLFHYIIIEHILECFVWWHSVSYVGHHLTLGHTPIFEFISFFLQISSLLDLFLDLCESSY